MSSVRQHRDLHARGPCRDRGGRSGLSRAAGRRGITWSPTKPASRPGHWQPLPGGLEFADDYVSGFAQAGTHCDALGHMWFDDTLWNGYPARSNQWRHDAGPASSRSPGAAIVGRGVLLDLARFRGKPVLARRDIRSSRPDGMRRAQGVEDPAALDPAHPHRLGRRACSRGKEQIGDDYWEPGLTFSLDLVRWFRRDGDPLPRDRHPRQRDDL